MSDLERRLREALRAQGDRFEPDDLHVARARFVERARRRRRLAYLRTGGAVVAAILLAVLVIPGTLTEPDPIDLAGAGAEVVATIPVGGAPTTAAAAPGGSVWVANGEQVVQIDPDSNEVLGVVPLADSDEVAATNDHVWISTRNGIVHRIDPATGEVGAETAMPRPQRLDLAARGDSLWAVGTSDGHLYETGASEGTFDEIGEDAGDSATSPGAGFVFGQQFEGMPLTDVAVGDAGLWALFRSDDSSGILQIDPDDITGSEEPIPVEIGDNADLAVGLGAVWVATGTNGTVERVDPATGEVSASVHVGGSYTDIAVGDGLLWAVTGGGEAPLLYQITDGGDMVTEPLALEGDPVDVTVGAGAVWVSDQDAAEVLRIEPRAADTPPAPDVTPTEPDAGIDPSEVLYVFSRDGDLFAQLIDGDLRQLTATEELELQPTFDGEAIVFEKPISADVMAGTCAGERVVLGSCIEWTEIASFDLGSGNEGPLIPEPEGWSPALGPDGRLAWFRSTPDGGTQLVIGESSGEDHLPFDDRIALEISGVDGFPQDLHWSRAGEALYFTTRTDAARLYQVSLGTPEDRDVIEPYMLQPDGAPQGTQFAASTGADEDGIFVLAVCCGSGEADPWETAQLGRIDFTEGGARYEGLRDLDLPLSEYTDEVAEPGDWNPAGESFTLESIGTWGPVAHDQTWGEDVGMIDPGSGTPGAFLVSDAVRLWWFAGGEDGPFELIENRPEYHGVSVSLDRLGY